MLLVGFFRGIAFPQYARSSVCVFVGVASWVCGGSSSVMGVVVDDAANVRVKRNSSVA